MKILITSARAPVALEWARIAIRNGHTVTLCDSLRYPIARFQTGVDYVRTPSPRFNFAAYQTAIHELISKVDWVIPTCEDIFYLAQLSDAIREKCFIPSPKLLFALHDKQQIFSQVPVGNGVAHPETRLITQHTDIILDQNQKTILKPVFSRFGRSVIRGVNAENTHQLTINPSCPWVQQAYIEGEGLCNYAICVHGEVIAHSAYRPKYLLNQAASTYFVPIQDKRSESFTRDFARQHSYHGQVAFDFIDDGEKLWLLECNPRSTSGLHLLAPHLQISHEGQLQAQEPFSDQACRVGASLPLLFAWQALCKGQWNTLWQDHHIARDVVANLPLYATGLAFGEMLCKSIRHGIAYTSASTFDIEYDGENDSKYDREADHA